jgi:FkbM family methyltransferase
MSNPLQNQPQAIDLQTLINTFLKFYAGNKHNKELDPITDFLLANSLSARGYNNYKTEEESGESFFIKEILSRRDPKLCLDIGANVGNYSLSLLRATNSKVISFEPLPVAFNELAQKTRDYSARLVLENRGVGSVKDNLTIHYNTKASAHASFTEEVSKVSYVSNDQKIVVPVISLDAYCEENKIESIDFVKIDVEGFESEVFEGAKRVFKDIRPKFIQIEFNWHQLFRNKTLNYFAEQLLDYEVYQLIPNGWIKRDPRDPLSNLYYYSNFVFVAHD